MRWLLLLLASAAVADVTPPIHAIMYEFDYDADGNILHAQVIGGYPSEDDCKDAMPRVMAMATVLLEKGLTPQLQCSGVHRPESPRVHPGETDL